MAGLVWSGEACDACIAWAATHSKAFGHGDVLKSTFICVLEKEKEHCVLSGVEIRTLRWFMCVHWRKPI